MKSMQRLVYGIFVFTALFLCSSNTVVWADEADEMRQILQSVANSITLYHFEDEYEIDQYDAIQLNGSTQNFDANSGQIVISKGEQEAKYRFFVMYEKQDGTQVEVPVRIGSNSKNGKILLQLNGTVFKDKPNFLIGLESQEGIRETYLPATSNEVAEITKLPEGTSWVSAAWDALWWNWSTMGKKLVETFCEILTPMGDAFLDMICYSVGEVTTIDGIVYGRVEKVDVDFFESQTNIIESGDSAPLKFPLKNILHDTVNKVYGFFRNFAVVVFMVLLVYVGLKILITSTAEKKANYKGILMAWVMGVVMLFFFPYVMKYTIQLNKALCSYIGNDHTIEYEKKEVAELSGNVLPSLSPYGKNEFVKQMLLTNASGEQEPIRKNAMMYVRYVGANYWQVPLLIVYFILIGQLLALLILYYKRVFMIGFLIAIFPLVAMIYPLNKMGDVKMNPFGVWFKEFAVNVFVQSFHAATYRVIVEVGVNSFINAEKGTGNWLFMIICTLFLFDGEKIIRAIFNAKSTANTIGDLAMSAAITQGIVKGAGGLVPDFSKKKEEKKEDKEEVQNNAKDKAKKDRVMTPTTDTPGAKANKMAAAAAGVESGATGTSAVPGSISSGSSTGGATYTATPISNSGASGTATTEETSETEEKTQVKLGRSPGATMGAPSDTLDKQIEERKRNSRLNKVGNVGAGIVKGAMSAAGGATMAIVEGSLGAALQGGQGLIQGTTTGISEGKKIGQAAGNLVLGAVDKVGTFRASRGVAKEYLSGAHDAEIGISEADAQVNKETAEALRKAYAKYARAKGMGGSNLAEFKFIKRAVNRKIDDK